MFQNVGKTVREGAPKTESSDAIIALDRGALKALRAHRERQLQEGEAFGASWTDTGRTFTWEDGSKLKPDRVSEHFRRLVFAAGLPPIRLHDLRHGAATLSLAAGNDMKTTSSMLRHSSQSITSDIYTSVLPEMAAEASAALVPRRAVVEGVSATGGLPSVSHAAPARAEAPHQSRNNLDDLGIQK
ncbi:MULTISPECIES: tyrosine-type recombinase/integrase [Nonomuraea]|uniref:Tyrosine-type recombinase/integrase n=1 Tax=Nonomuraea ferruginea TaxID=46174 RepID=A0ABT4T0T5_9ACTN|nr:tyrosine-type recombinase/integrase [Nonomuraea ferruginea]MDA0643108.1 tyrosine-type recombinase/integrase [Nonomuraea ferruginea]